MQPPVRWQCYTAEVTESVQGSWFDEDDAFSLGNVAVYDAAWRRAGRQPAQLPAAAELNLN